MLSFIVFFRVNNRYQALYVLICFLIWLSLDLSCERKFFIIKFSKTFLWMDISGRCWLHLKDVQLFFGLNEKVKMRFSFIFRIAPPRDNNNPGKQIICFVSLSESLRSSWFCEPSGHETLSKPKDKFWIKCSLIHFIYIYIKFLVQKPAR